MFKTLANWLGIQNKSLSDVLWQCPKCQNAPAQEPHDEYCGFCEAKKYTIDPRYLY
jgi:rubrerythrin